jgi:hypothetical protein
MKKLIILILVVLLVLLAGSAFFYNRLWTYSTIALLILLFSGFWVARKNTFAKVILFLFPFVLVLLLCLLGKWPLRPHSTTYGASSFPVLREDAIATLSKSADRIPSEPVDTRSRLQQRVFDELSDLRDADKAATEASRVWDIIADLPKVGWFHGNLTGLKNATAELESHFAGVQDGEVLSSQLSDLRIFLESSLASIRAVPDDGLIEFEADFDLKLRQYPAWRLTQALAQVRNELSVVLSDAAPSGFIFAEAPTVRLNDAEDAWVVTETYVFKSPDDVTISQLDATELVLETKAKSFDQTLSVSYADGDTVPGHGPVFRLNPNAPSFVLVNTVTFRPDSTVQYHTPLKPLSIKWLTFRWPDPFPVRVRLTADLSARNLKGATPLYVALDRTQPLANFRIPKHSHLASHLQVEVITSEEGDILTPHKEIGSEHFLEHRFIWFEILPPGRISRNPLVARFRNYVFGENLAIALLIAMLTALFTAVTMKK